MTCRVEDCTNRAIYATLQLCGKHYQRWRKYGEVGLTRQSLRGLSVAERLAHYRILPDDLNQCFGWSGYLTVKGYAALTLTGRNKEGAHRVAYREEVGDIPDGYTIDHICHNWDLRCPGGTACQHRLCTNPRHLQLATNEQNNHAAGKSRRPGYAHPNARKTHCPKGHEYTDENTAWTRANSPSGVARRCRMCLKEKTKRDNAKRRVG